MNGIAETAMASNQPRIGPSFGFDFDECEKEDDGFKPFDSYELSDVSKTSGGFFFFTTARCPHGEKTAVEKQLNGPGRRDGGKRR